MPVIGGAPDLAHPAVVSVASAPGAARAVRCSGTLIAPRVVLTAGHCTLGQSPADLVVSFGADELAPDGLLVVAGVHTYPGYTAAETDLPEGRDLGALVLSDDAGISPLPLVADGVTLAGMTAVLVGYGLTDPLDLDSGGHRRAATVPVLYACDRLLAFGGVVGGAAAAACLGDSGGPLLVPRAGGEAVAAVVSYTATDDCAAPAFAVLTDPYRAWIDTVIANAADDSCATSCPPNAPACSPPDAGLADAAGSDAGDDDATTNGCTCRAAPDRASRSPRRTGFVVALLVSMAVLLVPRRAGPTSGATPPRRRRRGLPPSPGRSAPRIR